MFFYKDPISGELIGLVGTHVDDFIHAGNAKFERNVMSVISREFTVGSREEKEFKYTGFEIMQERDQSRRVC